MDSATPRVEIELDEQEPKRSRRRAGHRVEPSVVLDAPPAAALDGDVVQPSHGAPRNQLVITALAVGLVALFLGWVLGRAGAGDDTATASPATSAAPATTATPSTSAATDDTLPEAQLPTTTRPRPTTTTMPLPAWEESTVQIDARLAGQADRLVATTYTGDLVEIDLSTGALRALIGPSDRDDRPNMPPIATDDWVLLRGDSGLRVYAGGSPSPVDLPSADPWTVMWQYGTNRFWTVAPVAEVGAGPLVEEIGVDGRRSGRSLDTGPFWPGQPDPAGGVVVGDGNTGFFTVDDTGSTRLPGLPVAMGQGHVLVSGCFSSVDDCGLRLVDRATSEWRPVAMDGLEHSPSGWWFGTWNGMPTITSDGDAAIAPIQTPTGEPTLVVFDFATGEHVEFDVRPDPSGMTVPSGVWSSDERFAYLLDGGVLTAYDRTSGESFPVIQLGSGPPEQPAILRLASVTIRVPTA